MTTPDISARLAHLDYLWSTGQIRPEEYWATRSQILAGLAQPAPQVSIDPKVWAALGSVVVVIGLVIELQSVSVVTALHRGCPRNHRCAGHAGRPRLAMAEDSCRSHCGRLHPQHGLHCSAVKPSPTGTQQLAQRRKRTPHPYYDLRSIRRAVAMSRVRRRVRGGDPDRSGPRGRF